MLDNPREPDKIKSVTELETFVPLPGRLPRGKETVLSQYRRFHRVFYYPGTHPSAFGLFSVPAPPFRLATGGGVFLSPRDILQVSHGRLSLANR
jgi:hypothetical protein